MMIGDFIFWPPIAPKRSSLQATLLPLRLRWGRPSSDPTPGETNPGAARWPCEIGKPTSFLGKIPGNPAFSGEILWKSHGILFFWNLKLLKLGIDSPTGFSPAGPRPPTSLDNSHHGMVTSQWGFYGPIPVFDHCSTFYADDVTTSERTEALELAQPGSQHPRYAPLAPFAWPVKRQTLCCQVSTESGAFRKTPWALWSDFMGDVMKSNLASGKI